MKIELKTGTLETAMLELLKYGGQIFPGRDGRDGITLVCGSRQYIYWNENSLKYHQLLALAKELKLPEPDLVTGGKLVKHILDISGINYEKTYFHNYYRKLALEGKHWHYQYYKEGLHGFCYEFDIKSAYWQSFLLGKSALLAAPNCWMNDNGGLRNLEEIFKDIPKFFRLQFLGTLASWKMNYYALNDNREIILKTRKNISYGALFNSAHKAIEKTYKIIQETHKRLREDCVRCHTDSVLVKKKLGIELIRQEMTHLQSLGYSVSCKKWGNTWIRDLNIGFVGKFPIGSRKLAINYAQEAGIKLKAKFSNEEEILLEQLMREFEFKKY